MAATGTRIIEGSFTRHRARAVDRNGLPAECWRSEGEIEGLLRWKTFNQLLAAGFAMFVACSVAYAVGRADLLADRLSDRIGAQPKSVAAELGTLPQARPESPVATAHAQPEPVQRAAPMLQTSPAPRESLPPPVVVLYPPRYSR